MKPSPLLFLVVALAFGCPVLPGETGPVQPTVFYLGIEREFVKPGMLASVVQARSQAIAALNRSGLPRTQLALVSLSSTEEVWLMSFFPNLGDLERDRAKVHQSPDLELPLARLASQEGSLLTKRRGLLLRYMPDSTYNPNYDWARMRYLDAITIHVRPGHHLEYLEMRRIAVAGHVKGGLDTHLIMFKVTSGEPGNTYLILRPMNSLDDHDRLRAQGFGEPLTDDENRRMIELQAASVDGEDEQFFRVVPESSLVTADWAKSDPQFWRAAAPD